VPSCMFRGRGGFLAGVMLLLGLAIPASASDPIPKRFRYTEGHMGTPFRIILYAANQTAADKAAQAAFRRIAVLDRIMSDYSSTSELMKLCQKAGGPPVRVSDDLFRVLRRAEVVSRISNGAFDVTVGPIVKLWRRARRTKKMPDVKALAKARALVGYRNIVLDPEAKTVQLLKPGMQLDLGGIAKGYAADEALQTLKHFGITQALVAAGGDIAIGAAPPDTEGWVVGIAPLEKPNTRPTRYLILHNAAVSTSGDAEQYVEIDGKRYSHIVDPHTGLGLVGRMSVTVVGPNGLTVDPLTKTVCVLGTKKGFAILGVLNDVSCLAVRKTAKGLSVSASRRWPLPGKLGKAKDAK
jgi:FAD:protein FMN transferase